MVFCWMKVTGIFMMSGVDSSKAVRKAKGPRYDTCMLLYIIHVLCIIIILKLVGISRLLSIIITTK